ncbi:hypothetical protein K0M31_001538 [Melipona bicolor]|uniref:Uncharacterized protein n=1 Tax=Melipona bicolor TaxID=60889 RepID=A0AA40GFU6_9HYME|nr:hypothetical protein K0M31_001538 [Melipona bicolor]
MPVTCTRRVERLKIKCEYQTNYANWHNTPDGFPVSKVSTLRYRYEHNGSWRPTRLSDGTATDLSAFLSPSSPSRRKDRAESECFGGGRSSSISDNNERWTPDLAPIIPDKYTLTLASSGSEITVDQQQIPSPQMRIRFV